MPADPFVASLLAALSSAEPHAAWCEFLDRYSGILYHVIRSFDRDPDRSGDCFLFVCEHLSRDKFRRLRKFDVNGRASFSTWLCAVARNLCLDWQRKQTGRFRVFRSVAHMDAADQVLFEMVFRRGCTDTEAHQELCRRGFDLNFAAVEERTGELRRQIDRKSVV